MPPKEPSPAGSVVARVRLLVKSGAALTLRLVGMPLPVSFVRKLDAHRWFFWEAGGETEFDGHVFAADRARVIAASGAVEFLNGSSRVARLEPVEIAFQDPDAAREKAAWIAGCRARFPAGSRQHRFVLRRFRSMRG